MLNCQLSEEGSCPAAPSNSSDQMRFQSWAAAGPSAGSAPAVAAATPAVRATASAAAREAARRLVLRRRLEGRGTETQEKIEIRLRNAREEVKLVNRYQYVIVNDDLDTAVAHLECIVNAEKLRTTRWCPALEEA